MPTGALNKSKKQAGETSCDNNYTAPGDMKGVSIKRKLPNFPPLAAESFPVDFKLIARPLC